MNAHRKINLESSIKGLKLLIKMNQNNPAKLEKLNKELARVKLEYINLYKKGR